MPISVSSDESHIEHLQYKLVLLGTAAVGKTSIVKQLIQHHHEQTYTPTVGVEFSKAEVQITDDIHATLQVWDIGSHVNSVQMAANYLHGCDAVLVVYDAAQQETFSQACEWVELLQQMFRETALPYIAVIANKLDDDSLLQAATDQLHRITADIPQAYSYMVSAKTGSNVQATFLRIAADLAGIPLTQQQVDARLLVSTGGGLSAHSSTEAYEQNSGPVNGAVQADTAATATVKCREYKQTICCGLNNWNLGRRMSARVASGTIAVRPKYPSRGAQNGMSEVKSDSADSREHHGPSSSSALVFAWLSSCSCCRCWTWHDGCA